MENLKEFHDLCERLTGDQWCPYPSQLMIDICLDVHVSDSVAKALIEKRREFLFPSFLLGEPMYNELMSIKSEIYK